MPNVLSGDQIDAFDLGYNAGSRFQTHDGIDIYYEEYGQPAEQSIVFLNNLFLIAPLWRNFTAKLGEQYKIIAYDLRNQGASSRVVGDVDFANHISDLAQLLQHLNVQKPFLVGSSDSTLLAREYVLTHPGDVAGIALYGPVFNKYGGRRRKRLLRSWISAVENGGPRGLFDHMFPLIYSHHTVERGGNATYLALRERFLALNSQTQLVANLSASINVDDKPDRLRAIDCPTLLAAGDCDFFASEQMLVEIAEVIPEAKIGILKDSGHAPYFEATHEFESMLNDFIQNAHTS